MLPCRMHDASAGPSSSCISRSAATASLTSLVSHLPPGRPKRATVPRVSCSRRARAECGVGVSITKVNAERATSFCVRCGAGAGAAPPNSSSLLSACKVGAMATALGLLSSLPLGGMCGACGATGDAGGDAGGDTGVGAAGGGLLVGLAVGVNAVLSASRVACGGAWPPGGNSKGLFSHGCAYPSAVSLAR